MLEEVTNLSKNVQVSCSLLELRGRHVVMFEVMVLQIAKIRQLVDNFVKSFTNWFCPNWRLLVIAHARFLAHLVPVWQMDLARLEVLFFFVTVWELCVVLKIHASTDFLWLQAAQRFIIFIFVFRNGSTVEVCHLRCHPVLGHELDMLIFVAIEQKLHVSSGEQNAHATFGWYARLVKSNTICPIVEYSTGEKYKPKAGHVIIAPFGSETGAIHQFCTCGKENRTSTSPVSSTSTLVEHGGVVGKLTAQLQNKVPTSELANTKRLIARGNSVVMP